MKPVMQLNWQGITSRGLLFAIIWWFLTDGAADSWWMGAPAVMLAVMASIALIPTIPLVWHELLRFVPFFIMRSLLGGADVAWRACHPHMPIAQDLIKYSLRLPPGLPSVFMVYAINLLPGTLSAELDQCTLKIHVLDRQKNFVAELEAVEQHVARIFGVYWHKSDGG